MENLFNEFEWNLDALDLDKETIARLDESQLREIAGGRSADDVAFATSCNSAASCSGGMSCSKGGSC